MLYSSLYQMKIRRMASDSVKCQRCVSPVACIEVKKKPLTRDELTYGPSGVALHDTSASAMALLMNEADEALGDGTNSKSVHRSIALHIYRGDYAHAASIALKANESPIPHEIMSLFIGGGYEVWSAVAKAQCDRLVVAGEIQQAAMLRLSLHDVPGAIATLRQGGLIRDAAAPAAARLLPTDALLIQTRRELAAAEETRGGMEAAAKAHLVSVLRLLRCVPSLERHRVVPRWRRNSPLRAT